MNAFKMTLVAAALIATGFTTEKVQAQGFFTGYGNCNINQYSPATRNTIPVYNATYPGGIYRNQHSPNTWNQNSYFNSNGNWGTHNVNHNSHNNWGSNNYWNSNYGYQNYNQPQFNQYSPYSSSYLNRPLGY